MQAVVLRDHGEPEVLGIEDIPDPSPGAEDVLVEVHSTALNRADLLQRRGLYPGPPAAFEVPGMEFAGTVVECGDRVSGVAVGDDVMGIVGGGAYAEKIVTHHRQVMTVPESVALADAAAIPEVFITAWDAMMQGGLAPGGTALVHAGASGVGTAAIQIANYLGASVVVTASAGKVQRCLDLGAHLAVDYTSTDYVDAVKEFTAGAGVDMVLDVVGGDYLSRNLGCLKVQGTIVQVGVMGEQMATFPLGLLLPLRATIRGTVLRARPLEEKIAVTRRFAREILPGFDQGRLQPVIDSRYELAAIQDAHRYMESNANVGKILIDMP